MIAFDFDNTLCMNLEDSWSVNDKVLDLLLYLQSQKINVVIVTARMSPDLSPSFGISDFYDKIYSNKYVSVEDFVSKHINSGINIYYTNGKYKADTLKQLGISILIDDNPYERAEAESKGIVVFSPDELF